MSKKEKSLAVVLLVSIVILSTFAGAVWFNGFSGSPTGMIINSEGIIWGDNFNIENLTLGNVSQSITHNVTITNPDGMFPLRVNVTTVIIDVVDSCDGTNDLNSTLEFNGLSVDHGDVIAIPEGDSVLEITSNAKKYSCPGSISTTLSLIEV